MQLEASSWFHPWLWAVLGGQGWTLCLLLQDRASQRAHMDQGHPSLDTIRAALGSLSAAFCSMNRSHSAPRIL